MRIHRRRNRILRRLVLGLAVAAVAAPTAQARLDEGVAPQGGNSSVQSMTDFPSTAAGEAIKSHQLGGSLRANDGIEILRIKSAQRSWPGIDPTSGQDYPRYSSPIEVVNKTGGFDWGDAGIGAGMALGLVLLGGAAVRASRYLGKPQTA
jgi:hypothetical protein